MSADLLFDAPPSDGAALVFGDEGGTRAGASANLVFRDAPASNNDLVFEVDPIEIEEPVDQTSIVSIDAALPLLQGFGVLRVGAHVNVSGVLPSPVGIGVLRFGVHVNVSGTLPDPIGLGSAQYLLNVQRPTVASVRDTEQVAQPVESGIVMRGQIALSIAAGAVSAFQDGAQVQSATAMPFTDAIRTTKNYSGIFQDGVFYSDGLTARMQDGDRSKAVSAQTSFQEGAKTQKWPMLNKFEDGLRDRRAWLHTKFQDAVRSAGRTIQTRNGYGKPSARAWHSRFQEAWVPRPGQYVRPVIPGLQPGYWGPHLVFACPPLEFPALVFGATQCDAELPDKSTVAVPIRKVYLVINNITLHRVDTGAELHAHSFSMSLDYQSWTWSWSASLHDDAAPHLGRDSQGDPAELIAQVNGTPFRLRLVAVGRDRRFSPTRWSVSGQGKAAVLAAPWAPTLSFGNPTAARTAQQLMADALTINGAGIGWAVDWGLQDWQVPAGAWAMQGSYIDAINDIASSVGGYVQPHATGSVLRILPRYPAAPWAWGSITPDFEIPEDAAEVEGTQYIDRPGYNRVFVGGVGAGVFGPLTRAGTAGNVIAPQVTHALITDATAHRQRGIAELSDTGKQEHITLTMQVLPETGVIMPGQFVRYLSDIPALGIVRSTSIDWSRPKLRQTIKLETHV